MRIALRQCTLSAVLTFALAAQLGAQSTYRIVTLPTLGGLNGQANSLNDRGWATGLANFSGDTVGHAALWVKPYQTAKDLGSLGGDTANSTVAWPVKNNGGIIAGISDTADDNPLGESFSCWPFFTPGTPTLKICKGFRWQNGTMTALEPFPGGYDSYATGVNHRGEIVGWAENGVQDPTCDPDYQILQFRAVIWEPDGSMRELPPLPGDSTSAATAINDHGDVVGISGACGIAIGGVSAAHAVLWHNGVPHDIGNFGGDQWNTPTAINNRGTVVGFSLPASQEGTTNFVAFIWTEKTGIQPLGMPDGDIKSEALGLNEKDQVVGLSENSAGAYAILWEEGKYYDLNCLSLAGSPQRLFANDINDEGRIVGEALVSDTGAAPGYIAFPLKDDHHNNAGSATRSQQTVLSAEQKNRIEMHAFRLGTDPRK